MAPKQAGGKKKKGNGTFCFFLFVFLFQRKISSGFVLLRLHCNKEEEDDNCSSASSMALPQKIGDLRLFAGLVAKKGTTTASSPSSLVA
jgi:hypothetical protein